MILFTSSPKKSTSSFTTCKIKDQTVTHLHLHPPFPLLWLLLLHIVWSWMFQGLMALTRLVGSLRSISSSNIMRHWSMNAWRLAWFQWRTSNDQLTSWSDFIQALQSLFAPSQYENPIDALFKLTQKGTVNSYLSEFEDLANRIVGLPSLFLLCCFVSRLSPQIRREVQALQPLTMAQAAGLARLQEKKLLDALR